jgi:DNA segregation ATPase FtsK/SpoIIIE, S-DNA-T family
MRFPITLEGRDVIVSVSSPTTTLGEATRAVNGAQTGELVSIGGRWQPTTGSFLDAGVRPGDDVHTIATPVSTPTAGGLIVHVVAGIDSGRSFPLPEVGATGDQINLGVGRDASMDVKLLSNGVSLHHCTLSVSSTGLTITDAGSRNGTVLNGVRVGDKPEALSVGELVRCGPAVFTVRPAPAIDTPQGVTALLATAASGPVAFNRSPVDLPPGPAEQVELPSGPRQPRTGRPGLIGLLLPMGMALGMVLYFKNLLYGMMALMGPLMMLMTTGDRAQRNRRIRKKSRRRYRQELVEFADDLDEAARYELRRRHDISPDLSELRRRAEHAGAALWSRRRTHPNFLTLSLGLADVPWSAPVAPISDDLPDLEEIVDRGQVLTQCPLTVDAQPGTTLGLAGERAAAVATARGLLLQVATLHGPAEVRIVVVASAANAPDWEWSKWLPHVRPTFAGGRLLAVIADEHGRIESSAVDEVLSDADSGAVLVCLIDTNGLADSGDVAVRRLLRRTESPATGIVLAPTVDGLPDQCDVVVDHHEAAGEATCRWPREAGRSLALVVAGLSSASAATSARALARLSDPDAGGGSASLPTRVSHAEVMGLAGAKAADITARWSRAQSLYATVGLGEMGAVGVDLQADGPHAVVVGARGSGKTEQLSSMVLSLAASCSPERLHLVLWGESFSHLHRLPHVASTVSRLDEGTLTMFLDGLDRELSRRERLRTQSPAGASSLSSEPRLVVVIDDIDTIARVLPFASDGLVRLLRRARGLGVHVLWSTGRHVGGVMNELVDLSPIRIVCRVSGSSDSVDLLGTEVAFRLERALPGRAYVVAGRSEPREVQGGAVSVGAPRQSDQLVVTPFSLAGGRVGFTTGVVGAPDEQALVPLIAAAGATSARPPDLLSVAVAMVGALKSPGLLELLGMDGADGLATATDHWHTIDAESFLRVPIGVDPEMRPVLLDLKESALAGMGPHGLLVGATGAGKSELLRTLVCGLAVTHSPEALAFVLVDFKGGASFSSLGKLPHVAGVVTNLADDLALVDRILAALGGEQKRRQELLAAAGNLGNVRDYRALRRAGKLPAHLADEPLPELLIIVDEFAELLDQEPAFIDFFLTIGRVGRSLGIHLLLASQRLEEGKLRGLDTYLSYRLGLRTFSASESRIVLGVPDAYSLPTAPGGGYLKVGSTSFERFQASYVSGPAHVGSEASVLDAIIEELDGAAEPVHQIWLAPLTGELPLDPLLGDGGFVNDPTRGFAAASWPRTGTLAVPIGVVDEPAQQRQLPLVLDFVGAHGTLALAGAPQSGKSLFLRTMVLALAVTHTPDEVQVYGVDYGGGSLEMLSGLPHVGTIASRLEPERVRRLISHVESLLTQREQLFRARGIDSIATFRRMRAVGELPADVGGDVFLLIDGWAAFRERFEVLEPTIADLASRGLGYGIHVVVTVNRWMEMRANVLDALGGRLELRLNSSIDSAIDRRRAAVIRVDQPGRGLHPSTLLFQTALPRLDGEPTVENLTAATNAAVEHIASRWTGAVAPPVMLLPTSVSAASLPAADGRGVAVGLQERGMEPWWFDPAVGDPHFFVYGDGESGKTTFLQTWLTRLAESTPPENAQVVLVDYRRTLLEVVPEDHLQAYAASEPAAREVIEAVAAEMVLRLPGADVTAAQLRDRSWWTGPEIYVVVDDYDLVVTPSGNPLSPLLPYLAQGRDVGLHVVLTRRAAGAAKMMYEPITARLREVSPTGLLLSGDRDEGPLIGSVRATEQPPGRGILVGRREQPMLVQVAISDPILTDA